MTDDSPWTGSGCMEGFDRAWKGREGIGWESIIFRSAISTHHALTTTEPLIGYTDDKLVNFNITSGVRNFLVSILTVIVPKRHILSSYSIPTQQFVVSYTLFTNKEFLSKYWGPRAKQTTRFPQDFQLLHVSLWSSKAVYLSSRFSEESGKLTNTKSYKLVRYFLYSTNVLPYFQNFELIRKRIAHKAKDWINVRTCPRVCKTCTYV